MAYRTVLVNVLKLNAAGVAKLAYAADSKWEFCRFCPFRNSSQPSDPAKENDLDALKPFAGLLGNFRAFLKNSLPKLLPKILTGNLSRDFGNLW